MRQLGRSTKCSRQRSTTDWWCRWAKRNPRFARYAAGESCDSASQHRDTASSDCDSAINAADTRINFAERNYQPNRTRFEFPHQSDSGKHDTTFNHQSKHSH